MAPKPYALKRTDVYEISELVNRAVMSVRDMRDPMASQCIMAVLTVAQALHARGWIPPPIIAEEGIERRSHLCRDRKSIAKMRKN